MIFLETVQTVFENGRHIAKTKFGNVICKEAGLLEVRFTKEDDYKESGSKWVINGPESQTGLPINVELQLRELIRQEYPEVND